MVHLVGFHYKNYCIVLFYIYFISEILFHICFISEINMCPSIFQHLLEQFRSLLSLNSHSDKFMPLRLNPANIRPFCTFTRLIDFNCKQTWSSQVFLMTPRVNYRRQSYVHCIMCIAYINAYSYVGWICIYFSLLCVTKTVLLLNNDYQNAHKSLTYGCEYDNRHSYYVDNTPQKSNYFLQQYIKCIQRQLNPNTTLTYVI